MLLGRVRPLRWGAGGLDLRAGNAHVGTSLAIRIAEPDDELRYAHRESHGLALLRSHRPDADLRCSPELTHSRMTRSTPFPGGYRADERPMHEGGERDAAEGVECQAGASVRAHQGRAQGARTIRRPRRGDRCADGEQGTRSVGRVEDEEPFIDTGHLVR